MHPDRIAELLQPFLGPADSRWPTAYDLRHISTYIDLLLRWNTRINLTAIRDPEEIVTRHFGESFFAARHLFPCADRWGAGVLPAQAERSSAAAGTSDSEHKLEGPGLSRAGTTHQENRALAPAALDVADLGSGAGFPGLPIKLWAPNISLTLIESNHKKVAFLREVTRALTLTDINVRAARAEALSGSSFAVVTIRAVERFASILPLAASLVSPGGRLALLIGFAQSGQAHSAVPHFSWSEAQPVPLSRTRVLVIAHHP